MSALCSMEVDAGQIIPVFCQRAVTTGLGLEGSTAIRYVTGW